MNSYIMRRFDLICSLNVITKNSDMCRIYSAHGGHKKRTHNSGWKALGKHTSLGDIGRLENVLKFIVKVSP